MQIFLTILFYIFVTLLIGCAIVAIICSLVDKSLLCAKIYTFIFEHDEWLLYKRAKKQGIQHYLNGYHFLQFYKENKCLTRDKRNKLAEKYHYKEYQDTAKNIKADDMVLSLNMFSGRLHIYAGDCVIPLVMWKPLVKDVLKNMLIKNRVFYALLDDPKMVVSF